MSSTIAGSDDNGEREDTLELEYNDGAQPLSTPNGNYNGENGDHTFETAQDIARESPLSISSSQDQAGPESSYTAQKGPKDIPVRTDSRNSGFRSINGSIPDDTPSIQVGYCTLCLSGTISHSLL